MAPDLLIPRALQGNISITKYCMNLGKTKLDLHLDGGLGGAHVGQSFATGNRHFDSFVEY